LDRGAWRGQRGVVALREDHQIVEINVAVVVEVALAESLAGAVVVLGECDQVIEIDGAIVVGVGGRMKKSKVKLEASGCRRDR